MNHVGGAMEPPKFEPEPGHPYPLACPKFLERLADHVAEVDRLHDNSEGVEEALCGCVKWLWEFESWVGTLRAGEIDDGYRSHLRSHHPEDHPDPENIPS